MGGGRALALVFLFAASVATAAWAQTPGPAPGAAASAGSAPSSITAPPSGSPALLPSASVAPQAGASAPRSGASSPQLLAATSAPVATQPFGAGVPVSIDCDKPFAYAYVAKGAVDTRQVYPDPFVKVGRLPLTIELPAGVYTLIVEGETVTTGSTVFEVRAAPVRVKVSAGKSGLRSFSSWTLAFGIAAVLAAGVLELSFGGKQDAREKHAISIPLFVVGGVGVISGLGMYFGSRTSFQGDGFVPGKRAGGPDGATWGISGRF